MSTQRKIGEVLIDKALAAFTPEDTVVGAVGYREFTVHPLPGYEASGEYRFILPTSPNLSLQPGSICFEMNSTLISAQALDANDSVAPIPGIALTIFESLTMEVNDMTVQELPVKFEAYRNELLMRMSGGEGSGKTAILNDQYLYYQDTAGSQCIPYIS